MDQSTFGWLFWLGGFFLAYELAAVLMHWRTLSAQTWNWFSLGQRKLYWFIRRAVFVVFWVLLGIHFIFQAPALWSVILPGVPFALIVVLSTFVWKDATVAEAEVVSKGVDPMTQRILAALVYGAVAVFGALQVAGLPKDEQGWLGVVGVFATAAWGKFSHPERPLSPNREIWTPERRAVEAGK